MSFLFHYNDTITTRIQQRENDFIHCVVSIVIDPPEVCEKKCNTDRKLAAWQKTGYPAFLFPFLCSFLLLGSFVTMILSFGCLLAFSPSHNVTSTLPHQLDVRDNTTNTHSMGPIWPQSMCNFCVTCATRTHTQKYTITPRAAFVFRMHKRCASYFPCERGLCYRCYNWIDEYGVYICTGHCMPSGFCLFYRINSK